MEGHALTDPIDVLARTIWGEARGEAPGGMEAVAAVIVNRANHPRWWGRDLLSVCLKPWQFSCWNEDDPNRSKMLAVTPDDPDFLRALGIADRAALGRLSDPTHGADSYADLRYSHPSWAQNATPVAKIGNHTFFKLEL
jgi:hypothetical protein